MKKSISILAIIVVGVMPAISGYGAQMTSQIQRLLEQKEEKIKKLEECEGKKQGWKIAGISTIGLTAVGVGVNIAQSNKSDQLSDEIDLNRQQLERQQEKLSRIETQIAQKEHEKAERERAEKERAEREQAERAKPGQDGVEVGIIQSPELDHNDGKIGEACDDGKGVWVTGGNKICVDAGGNGLQDCHCEPNTDNNNDGQDEESTYDNRDAVIAGYCLNQEGDTGDLDYSKKTFCWCDIYMPNYCSQSRLFDDNVGICSGTENGNDTVCQTFCEGKKAALIKICDDLQ